MKWQCCDEPYPGQHAGRCPAWNAGEAARVANEQPRAIRHNAGKTRYDLVPADFLYEFAMHFTRNLVKYPENNGRNWERGMPYSECYASAMRHLQAWWMGEDYDDDPKSGRAPHLIAACWNLAALLCYQLRGVGTDDRPKVAAK